MKIWPILTQRLKQYENLAIFDKDTEKVCMKIWPFLTRRLKKCENMANFERGINSPLLTLFFVLLLFSSILRRKKICTPKLCFLTEYHLVPS